MPGPAQSQKRRLGMRLMIFIVLMVARRIWDIIVTKDRIS